MGQVGQRGGNGIGQQRITSTIINIINYTSTITSVSHFGGNLAPQRYAIPVLSVRFPFWISKTGIGFVVVFSFDLRGFHLAD